MVRITASLAILAASVGSVLSSPCPMAELTRRGLAPRELADLYARGHGLSAEHLSKRNDKRLLDKTNPDGTDTPPALDPLSGILSPIGAGALVPRSDVKREHIEEQRAHILARRNQPDHEVDVDSAVLTPKAHKRYVEERGLLGGILSPLTGVLEAIDLPTPQESGLKAIPGDDPDHQYQAPGATDIRGDCPTLNTLANHGYLSRDGITTFAEAANAIQTAYSMAFDIAVVLSAFGLLAGGDPVTGKYSIGGQDDRVPNTLGPALGLDRHGLFELDGSISRSDKGFGDNHSFNTTKWDALIEDANTAGGGYFNADAFTQNYKNQITASRNTNPDFSQGANFIFANAIRVLTYRPLPNGTTPDVADYANIAPFFLNETFPENWYRIPNSYSFADLLVDAGTMFLAAPQPFGRNQGVGKFVPVDVNVPTAPRDVGCAGFGILANGVPGIVASEFTTLANAVVNQILSPAFGSADCDFSSFSEPGISNNQSNQETVTSESGSGVTGLGQHDTLYKTSIYSGSGNDIVYQDTGYDS